MAKTKTKRAVLDVDGVLVDCEGGFVAVGTAALRRPLVKLNNSYNFAIRYNMTEDEVVFVFDAMMDHPQGWGKLDALPGASKAFARLQRYGYEIHLVSAIPEKIRDLRAVSLEAHGMIPDAIHCAGHHRASKSEIIRQINPVMFVDDRLKHLHEAHFVPERVLVDLGDEQDGLTVCDQIIQVKNLASWVDSWALSQGYDKLFDCRPRLSVVHSM